MKFRTEKAETEQICSDDAETMIYEAYNELALEPETGAKGGRCHDRFNGNIFQAGAASDAGIQAITHTPKSTQLLSCRTFGKTDLPGL